MRGATECRFSRTRLNAELQPDAGRVWPLRPGTEFGLESASGKTTGPALKRAFLQLACIFLLLFAQQSGLTHAAWHAHGQPPVQQDSKNKASFQGSLCDLHVAFSAVLGGAHDSTVHHSADACIDERIVQQPRRHDIADLLTPLSRGPPALL
ncbi:MAG TPA: hypothetical protein VLT92_10935, partial [Burkholderiales bacterium]|nr:hypothetical protein [Burkholderiales bacterium]